MTDAQQAEQGVILRSLAVDHGLPLRHYSEKPFTLDRERQYKAEVRRLDKPMGFWISVQGEDDWPSWCRAEDFRTHRLEVEYEVAIKPTASVLYLSTLGEILEFSDRYHKDEPYFTMSRERHYGIDWETVTSQYDGMIIAPYVWAARMDVFWYYSWDCASGVIWNLDAIEDLSVITR